jgi:ribonucleoside-diphosphate reductase alpha chain
MEAGDKAKRKTWAKVLQSRNEVGFPYIVNTDNANQSMPEVYKKGGYKINASNLCSEIMLPSSDHESFVCVLSSVNVLHYDEWKDTDLIEVMTMFLDAVNEEFLTKLEAYRDSHTYEDHLVFEFMKRAYNFAKNHRALGLGVLGWHSLLQSKRLSFESRDAAKLNVEVFKNIRKRSYAASEKLARMFGEPSVLKGWGRRNTTTMAVAPTTSSAFILGQVSQSVEPLMSNYYIKDLAKMKVEVKNPFLEKLLDEKGHNNKKVWESIAKRDGSVRHLVKEGVLTEEEAEVFLTFREISPMSVIGQAATRQTYIDQSQSLNLMFDSSYDPKEINKIVLDAFKMGIKSLYYHHSVNAAQEFARQKKTDCPACE